MADTKKIVSVFDEEIETEGNKLLELGWTLRFIGHTFRPSLQSHPHGNVAYFGWTRSSAPIPITEYEKWTVGGGQQTSSTWSTGRRFNRAHRIKDLNSHEQKSDHARGMDLSGHVRSMPCPGHDPATAVQNRPVAGFDYHALRAPCGPILRAHAVEGL